LIRLTSLLFLCVPLSLVAVATPAQSNATTAQPKTMRLCVGPNSTDCANLTWAHDHYDGRRDNEVQPSSTYAVTVWSADRVELAGKANTTSGEVDGTFHGKISPSGGSLIDAIDQWRTAAGFSGNLDFTLTWSKDPSNVVSVAQPVPAETHAPPPRLHPPVRSSDAPLSPSNGSSDSTKPAQPHSSAAPVGVATKFTQTAVAPPKTMRLCVDKECNNLTWVEDHYEGRKDGQTAVATRYWITTWHTDHVEFVGTTATAVANGFPARATYTGKIAPDGLSITDGNFDWHVATAGSGSGHYTLTWTAAAAKAAMADVGPIEAPHRSKTHPNILLPGGATEVYASFPSDIRAILVQAHDMPANDALLPCDDTKDDDGLDIKDPNVAVEIGRYALRKGEFARGHCWLNHSAYLGSQDGIVLLGVVQLMGWGRPKDDKAAFKFFNGAYRSGNPWAAYFLDRCYREGIGVPADINRAVPIETSSLLSDDAQTMFALIDSDDLEIQREKERDALIRNPPTKPSNCTPRTPSRYDNPNVVDHRCDPIVDQPELDRELQGIDDRYAAIK
jgi:hypothetical protein